MPMPWSYRHAGKEWRGFLDDAKDQLGTTSDNVTYTVAEGVFRAFRSRLTTQQALDFAQILPTTLRALFVQDWQIAEPQPWADPETYLRETRDLRKHHNLAPENALFAVSFALHRAIQPAELTRALDKIAPEAVAFWHLENVDPAELGPRFR
ncbi:hypothetical protein TRP8649_04143 [Pelagimonas phthalicica]|uniref:DUF2267 domain-containing protein n=1 Tax=Pelagimonas phthalicica TaxID=1037362 RepID=A0A238JHY4_9RHOB|nr:DUF2267 domain-containing protein [Pelagimonas phthalicica]TDS89836.1 uncharacterized protein (DUF2267 family) [Pelagimonas phthalicica]SMX30003.1 hypothetical protein TRP8649_04143 [Pelagimonas phthalicica]